MDELPGKSARLRAMQWVLWGCVAAVIVEVALHLFVAWSRARPIHWGFQIPTVALGAAALVALRWLRRSFSRAVLLFAWIGLACLSAIFVQAVPSSIEFGLYTAIIAFQVGVFIVGLILGSKAAIPYATATALVLVFVGVRYVRIERVLFPIVLTYLAALPAKVVERLIQESVAAQEQIRRQEYEIQQLERELEIAWQLQTSLLPPAAPQIAGLDIAGWSQPARQVGGDFYNYFVFDQGRLGIAVGDVSGKGMPAALMMALAFGLLSTKVHRELAPATLLNALNTGLCPHTQRNNLNTALTYLTLESNHAAWHVQVGNAGLIAPLVRRRDGTTGWLNARGLPLGAMGDISYNETHQTLQAGDALVVCSDGMIEAMNEEGEVYGFDRLVDCMTRIPSPTRAQEIVAGILADMRAFTGDVEPADDVTIVAVIAGA